MIWNCLFNVTEFHILFENVCLLRLLRTQILSQQIPEIGWKIPKRLSHDAMIAPLQNFLDGEMRNIMKVGMKTCWMIQLIIQTDTFGWKRGLVNNLLRVPHLICNCLSDCMQLDSIPQERKILENKRLDLDACKNKVRKARAMQLQPPVSLETYNIPYQTWYHSDICWNWPRNSLKIRIWRIKSEQN